MSTKDDKITKDHNELQQKAMFAMFERERWYFGVLIKRDPRESWADMNILENRISAVVLGGYGEWLAEEIHKGVLPEST
jgi:hypothetical protein